VHSERTDSVLIELEPGGLLAWILVGLVAGWLAATLTRGRGFGCLGNIAVGLAGAIVGGFIFQQLDLRGPAGFLGSVLVASIGAALLLVLVYALGGRR
jgi:uncharacterized membrane protein YeaQ/YmgE (transglycosylase-associated protein family)